MRRFVRHREVAVVGRLLKTPIWQSVISLSAIVMCVAAVDPDAGAEVHIDLCRAGGSRKL